LVPANSAEGFRKKGRPDNARFLNIAPGSLESRCSLIVTHDLNFGDSSRLMAQLEEFSRRLKAYADAIDPVYL